MLKQSLIISTFAAALLTSSGAIFAADQEQVYGSQLMTQQERLEYRKKHREAKTEQEREQIRNEHHAMMKERARERNVTLPDGPPARGSGMGPGGGMGSGGGPRP